MPSSPEHILAPLPEPTWLQGKDRIAISSGSFRSRKQASTFTSLHRNQLSYCRHLLCCFIAFVWVHRFYCHVSCFVSSAVSEWFPLAVSPPPTIWVLISTSLASLRASPGTSIWTRGSWLFPILYPATSQRILYMRNVFIFWITFIWQWWWMLARICCWCFNRGRWYGNYRWQRPRELWFNFCLGWGLCELPFPPPGISRRALN